MNTTHRKYYLLNVVFVIGLILLFLNDHFLKLAYSNWFTGKLSDFLALLLLPLYYYLLKGIPELNNLKIKTNRLKPVYLLLPALFVFMATSPPVYYQYTFSDGALRCYKCNMTVKHSKAELLAILTQKELAVSLDSLPTPSGYPFDYYWKDSTNYALEHYPYYKIDTLIIEQDTITDFQFALESISEDKTKIWLNGMNISQEITDKQVERQLRKYYRSLIKKYLKAKIGEKVQPYI